MDTSEVRAALDSGTVVIQRSARRRKTIQARREGDRVVIRVPASLSVEQNLEKFARLLDRVARAGNRMRAGDAALARRCLELNARYFDDGIEPVSVRWVENQNTRWASASTDVGAIRVSHRLQHVPDWVLDSVLVHELAHLRVAGHTPEFHALANRFPRQAEAKVFLSGFSHGEWFSSQNRSSGSG